MKSIMELRGLAMPAAGGASSRTTWQFVPLTPKELIPHRNTVFVSWNRRSLPAAKNGVS
ncbi:hypothetical protein ACP26L_27440 [Paenibacillus sp. S-38]|uniref:hypothetical protein n=1 Tax=Paenibacillus sp. S-38 TaxID=3416710 RepID=UPI003CEA7DA1